jgi:hypothetical protein
MATETTKKQPERQDSATGAKSGSGGQQARRGSEDTRSPEEHYGGHREPHVQGGAVGAQQNPQGKQEPQEQPGQSRERSGSTRHNGGQRGATSTEYNPPPAQQGQYGYTGGSSDRGGVSRQGQSGQKKQHEGEQKKDLRH